MLISEDEVKKMVNLTESIVNEIEKVSAGVDHSYKWKIVDYVETSNKLKSEWLDKFLEEHTRAKSTVA